MARNSTPAETGTAGERGEFSLLDFGDGRRLEQWGPLRLDRPDWKATGRPSLPSAEWERADARFEGRVGKGRWIARGQLGRPWLVRHGGLTFEVRLAPSMHTGLFPEQAEQWQWMRETAWDRGRPLSILNLFAYTGAASIALAAAGHTVTHVDASRPVVGWAQRNAALNRVHTIRWIHDDARAFVEREVVRGHRYDALLLDPPEFGHGAAGVWKLQRDLPALLERTARLLVEEPTFVLVNEYSRESDATRLEALVSTSLSRSHAQIAAAGLSAGSLALRAADGRALDTGVFARWRS